MWTFKFLVHDHNEFTSMGGGGRGERRILIYMGEEPILLPIITIPNSNIQLFLRLNPPTSKCLTHKRIKMEPPKLCLISFGDRPQIDMVNSILYFQINSFIISSVKHVSLRLSDVAKLNSGYKREAWSSAKQKEQRASVKTYPSGTTSPLPT